LRVGGWGGLRLTLAATERWDRGGVPLRVTGAVVGWGSGGRRRWGVVGVACCFGAQVGWDKREGLVPLWVMTTGCCARDD
jgi:hypothetical protein